MAIQKTTLVSLIGPVEALDNTLLAMSELDNFHPEEIVKKSGTVSEAAAEENPFTELLEGLRGACSLAGISAETLQNPESCHAAAGLDTDTVRRYVGEFRETYGRLSKSIEKIEVKLAEHAVHRHHLDMLQNLGTSFDELFACRYLQVRFGRLPRDSYRKLLRHEDRDFFHFDFHGDEHDQYLLYITDEAHEEEIDAIMDALYFERIRIPTYLHGKPAEARAYLQEVIDAEKEQLGKFRAQQQALVDTHREDLVRYFCTVKFLQETWGIRRFVGTHVDKVTGKEYFEFVGYVPRGREDEFATNFQHIDGVAVEFEQDDDGVVNMLPGLITVSAKNAHDSGRPAGKPTKLKNNWFFRPFEMFVEMYGVPSHREIDPTPFVAITYSLLFGIMFGDVGQGLLLVLIGAYVGKKKNSRLAQIMMRVGIVSTLFGFVYGSVFGFEHLLDPLYHALGFHEKPVEVMDASMINILLIGAVGLGVVLILATMCINIYIGFKNRDFERCIFGQNGLAGLLLYSTIIAAIALPMLGVNFSLSLPIVLACIILPIFCIFLKEPLAHLVKKMKAKPAGGFGGYLVESGFELLEIAISFVANTMSYLRVGGFILSHAGMMSVVFSLSGMFGATGSVITIILGNLFVMALEALIVGIQVLRLEFYEMFARYYTGDGVAFTPVSHRVHESK